jgi:hypothetical protein
MMRMMRMIRMMRMMIIIIIDDDDDGDGDGDSCGDNIKNVTMIVGTLTTNPTMIMVMQ